MWTGDKLAVSRVGHNSERLIPARARALSTLLLQKGGINVHTSSKAGERFGLSHFSAVLDFQRICMDETPGTMAEDSDLDFCSVN